MDSEGVSLSHPYDFFRIKNPSAIPGHCFVIMPFSSELRPVYEAIESAIGDLMICTRADDLPLSDSILERILHGIGTAELIIVDVTGKNANVFYELGLAHTRTKNVLLITQNAKELPFDLRDQFCYEYHLHSPTGRDRLAQAIRKAALRIRAKSVPNQIDGAPSRTKAIVSYMERLLSAPQGVEGLLIRVQARLSSLGNVGESSLADEPQTRQYSELLERERDLLIKMLEQGALLQGIISPDVHYPGIREPADKRKARFDRVLSFLASKVECVDRCQLVISPFIGNNLLFFGEEILFEGHKTGIHPGFGLTVVHTELQSIRTRIGIFDLLFESSRAYTLQTYARPGSEFGSREVLRRAVVQALKSGKRSRASTRKAGDQLQE